MAKNAIFTMELFIDDLVNAGALKFGGPWTLKSGREAPFFLNLGDLSHGRLLAMLAEAYGDTIYEELCENGIPEFDVLFGPAYKGIPLAAVVAQYLWQEYHIDVRYCANRKEAKDHGEGGDLVGGPIKPGDKVVIIEDVTTSGASIAEIMPTLQAYGAVPVAEIIAMDRCERAGDSPRFALDEIQAKYGFPVISITDMDYVIQYLYTGRPPEARTVITDEIYQALTAYYEKYRGVRSGDDANRRAVKPDSKRVAKPDDTKRVVKP